MNRVFKYLRSVALIVVLLMIVLNLSVVNPVSASEPFCIAYTPQMTADTFHYLNEIYIEKHPDLGLRFMYGTPEDERILSDLAAMITEGCTTDMEKAIAIENWITRNITYSDASPLAIDAFKNRSGNCVTFAQLMVTLLRLEGIPAAWTDGWRGDMESTLTPDNMFNQVGHMWCYAYIDGQWMLFDPLWFSGGTTDQNYISKWYWNENVEGITPVYDRSKTPPEWYRLRRYYSDGIFTGHNSVDVINFGLFLFSTPYSQYDGVRYVDESRDESRMVEGELYRDGWVWEGSKIYIYENGIHAVGTIINEGEKTYYCDVQTTHAFEVLCDEDDYSLVNGYFTVKPGFIGTLKSTSECNNEEYRVEYVCDNSSLAVVDNNGTVTALQPGHATISAHFYRISDDVYMGSGSVYQLLIMEDERVVDYSDSYTDHAHTYTPIIRYATNGSKYVIYTCTVGDCAHGYVGTDSDSTQTDGWSRISGKWYYYENGVPKVGWLEDGGRYYYFDETGVMQTGWEKIGEVWYYMEPSGARAVGWQLINGDYYYFYASGVMKTGWLNSGGKRYFFRPDGAMATGWVQYGGKWYCMDESGAMMTGWIERGGKKYYLQSDGVMVTGTVTIGGEVHQFDENGVWQGKQSQSQNGWVKEGGKWCYYKNGVKVTGWLKDGGKWYYFDANGIMMTGWVKVGSTWYYMTGSGAMHTGWLQLDGKWYYMNSSGAMVTGTVTIDGKTYKFSSSGVWIP